MSVVSNLNRKMKFSLASYSFIVLLGLVFFIQVFKILQLTSMESMFFSMTFVFLIIMVFAVLKEKVSKSILFIVFVLISQTILSVLIVSNDIDFSYLTKMLLFISTILGIFVKI